MPRHVFVDETKSRDYLLVACTIAQSDCDLFRKKLGELVLPGQRRLHMAKESATRRRLISSMILKLGVSAVIYNAGPASGRELRARAACLWELAADAARDDHDLLVLEQDDSLVQSDRRVLFEASRANSSVERLRYEHRRPRHEHLLALPDAIAWSWARGGEWRNAIRPAVGAVRNV